MATIAERARGKKREKHNAEHLVEKLEFIAQIQKKEGGDFTTHCVINNGSIRAFDGTFSLGVPLDENLSAVAHTQTLLAGLRKAVGTVGIVQDPGALSVVSGKMRVKVKTLPIDSIPYITPDAPVAILNEEVRNGIAIVCTLAKEGQVRLVEATVLLESMQVSSTNTRCAVQYWHGVDLPPNLALPRKFCDMVVKHKAALTGFGFTPNRSVTFWFDDGSFIKTAIQNDVWPNLSAIMPTDEPAGEVPTGLLEGLQSVVSFDKAGLVQFSPEGLTAGVGTESEASYELAGIPFTVCYNGADLLKFMPYITRINFGIDTIAGKGVEAKKMIFYGERFRGALIENRIK